MKFPKGGLQLGISSVEDIRILLKAWNRQVSKEGQPKTWSALVYVQG
jgi:hypothetical protein